MSELCPCGSGLAYDQCCRPYIEGEKWPETAEALVRSRYTAYGSGHFDYLVETTHPDYREGITAEQLAQRVSCTYQFEGNIYGTQADRDNAVKAVLREEIIGEFAAEHDGEYPGDEYVTQEVEKRFQALYPTPTAAPEVPAATPETAA